MWAWGSYVSADIQERQALHKASLLEGKTKGYSSCLPRQAALRLPPQLSEPGEMVNSHAGHWASVQGLMGHHNLQHIYRKVCVLETYSKAAQRNSYKQMHMQSQECTPFIPYIANSASEYWTGSLMVYKLTKMMPVFRNVSLKSKISNLRKTLSAYSNITLT